MGRAVVAVSFVAIGFGTAPAFLVSFLAPVLQDDLGLSRTAIGVLVGVMFGATGLGCILAGRVTEIIGARWSVGLDGVLLAGALLLPVLLPGYPALVTCVVLAGIGYGLVQVATNVAVVAALPPQHHGVGLAVKTAGVPPTSMSTRSKAVSMSSVSPGTCWKYQRILPVFGSSASVEFV